MYAAALRLHREVDYLPVYFPDPDSEAYYFWVVNFGLRLWAQKVGAFLPELPPGSRMTAVSGSSNLEYFLNAGCDSAEQLLKLLRNGGVDPFAPRRVLDFGCGCARVLRHLLPLARTQELFGSDVDEDAIRFCRGAIAGARFFTNPAAPPMAAESESFGLVFSISVFTHLSRRLFERWQAEIGRILPAGGLAAISFHGEHAWNRMHERDELRSELLIHIDELRAARDSWETEGFAFLGHPSPAVYTEDDPYGLVFVRRETISKIWSGFDVVHYEEGALSGFQDLVLFRRR